MTRRISVAVFDNEPALMDALGGLRERKLEILDVHTPYPIHGIEEAAGIPHSRLPAVCLVGGLVGLGLAFWLQYWTSATDWPLDVGGKPFDSFPAFLPVAFELTVLVSGVATVVALLARSSLFPGRRPRLTGLGTTDDKFAVVVHRRDASVSEEELSELFLRHGAVKTLELMEDEA